MENDREALRIFLPDYLRQKGLHLGKAFRCLNPEHEDKHPSMQYDPARQQVHCFACGVNYDLFDLIGMDYRLDRFPEQMQAVRDLFSIARSASDTATQQLGYNESVRVPNSENRIDRAMELAKIRQGSAPAEYLHLRGIQESSCHKHGFFQKNDRAYLPVLEKGICTGWCARSTKNSAEPRYKNSKGALGLWNGDLLGQPPKQSGFLYITEGILDAVYLEQTGKHALSLCGSQNIGKLLTRCRENLEKAARWQLVLCGDPDPAGQKMNDGLAKGLSELGLRCRVLELPAGAEDIGDLYVKDLAALKTLLESVEEREDPALSQYAGTAAGSRIEDFFLAAQERRERGGLSCGFSRLDELLDGGFYPGLYVVGAISSLGKTSFALQVADTLSENGRDVLFFSLEQSGAELLSKSLSRTTALLDGSGGREAFTSRQLLTAGKHASEAASRLLEQATAHYASAGSRLFVREGVADIGAAEIRSAVGEHLRLRGQAPVVFVDYLQILKPWEPRATDKQNTDRAVVELKRISRDFGIPVVAVSSFNRDNYRTAVSMEAFKESGAVEYSADVLFGMQLAGAGESGFDVNAAKLREPRRVELVLLKNRNGVPYGKITFDYFAKFNLFREEALRAPQLQKHAALSQKLHAKSRFDAAAEKG